MQNDDYTPMTPQKAKPRTGRLVFSIFALAFVLGGGLVGWLAWQGQLAAIMPAGQISSQIAEPSAPPSAVFSPIPALATNAPSAAIDSYETRLALLEDRLSRLNLEASAASGNAARAEALLIAFAARRMIDRGQALGYLEGQLKLRFGDSQPNAVETIITASQSPLTLEMLATQLDSLAPKLSSTSANDGGWSRIKRELAGLFIIRHEQAASPAPENRFARARMMLASGKIDGAIAEVRLLPGASAAQDWMGAAGRFETVQRALDQLETSAMLDSRDLQDATGEKVETPSPLAAPVNGLAKPPVPAVEIEQ